MRRRILDLDRPAMRNGLRAAVVVPAAFALSLGAIGSADMALFASFGSIGLLIFTRFEGSARSRLRAYLGLIVAGVVTISLGTLASEATGIAVVTMACIGFLVTVAGAGHPYAAAARSATILTFIVSVMVPAGIGSVPTRLAGWGVAGAFSLIALFALLPAPERAAPPSRRNRSPPAGPSGREWTLRALRVALALGAAVLVARITDAQNGFWVVLAALTVLHSNAVATERTAVQALAGTLIGILVGAPLVAAIGGHTALLWALLPFAVFLAAYAPRAISFAAGQTGFTMTVVLLFNLLSPVGWTVGLVRIEDIAMGCAVSVLVGILTSPPTTPHRYLRTGAVREAKGGDR